MLLRVVLFLTELTQKFARKEFIDGDKETGRAAFIQIKRIDVFFLWLSSYRQLTSICE